MKNHSNLQKRIIDYWDRAGIVSFDSSTCSGDRHLASCTNFVESMLLDDLLKRQGFIGGKGLGIDIGAGLGRFTVVIARYLGLIHSLEPAKSLYPKLAANCAGLGNVKVFNSDFESFDIREEYDVAVVSGLFYLYSDDIVIENLMKFARHSKAGSIIIVRDFIVKEGIVQTPSSFIDGSFCYYRDISYWTRLAKKHDFELIEVFQAKPSYPMPKLMRLMQKSGTARFFSLPGVKKIMYQKTDEKRTKGIFDFRNSPILTAFLVMRKR